MAFLISITPAALGFREAAIAFVASQMNITPATAISVALLDRVVFSLTNVVFAQLVLAVSYGRWREKGDATKSSTDAQESEKSTAELTTSVRGSNGS